MGVRFSPPLPIVNVKRNVCLYIFCGCNISLPYPIGTNMVKVDDTGIKQSGKINKYIIDKSGILVILLLDF